MTEASRFIPTATVMLEPVDQGVLMTTHYLYEVLERLALILLGFPFEVEVLEPTELRDALIRVATKAMKLANQA